MPEDHDSRGFVAVARIARTRGIRGEVIADIHTDFPSRFETLARVWLRLPDGTREGATLEECWGHQGRLVLKFEGFDSIEASARLAGAWVEVAPEDAVELPEGIYYDHDLVGCRVRGADGREIGTVSEVLRIAGNHQLVVATAAGECLIPAHADICREVSIERKEIVVELPEGLIDLNR